MKQIRKDTVPRHYEMPEILTEEIRVENGFAASTENLYEDETDIPW